MTSTRERTNELYGGLQNIGITMWPDRWVEKWIGRGVTADDIEHAIGRARERMGNVEDSFVPHTRWIDQLLVEFEALRSAGKQPPYEAERASAQARATHFDTERDRPDERSCASCGLTESQDDPEDMRWGHRPDNPEGHRFELRTSGADAPMTE